MPRFVGGRSWDLFPVWNENMPFLPDPELPGGSWELGRNPYRMALNAGL